MKIKKMKYQALLYALVILLTTGCGGGETTEQEAPVRPVRFGEVQQSGTLENQTFSGTAKASTEANLSFKVNGTINNLNVKIGDKIRRGHTIATLDAIDYSVQYDQAVAQLKSAETQIKIAESQLSASRSNYERIEKLYENNSVPISDYEQAKSSYETAQSQYDAAVAQVTASQKQVQSSSNQVSYASLAAPFAGVVTQVMAEENEFVPAGNPIALLSSDSDLEVTVGVPEIFISRIRRGQKVQIRFSVLPGKVLDGTVSEVGFSSANTSTYPITVSIGSSPAEIRPGMAATVSFEFGSSDSEAQFLVAPVKAIGEDPQGNFVFRLQPEGENYKAVKQQVEIGKLLANGFEVKSGLSDGDLVATAGLKSLLDGMIVKLSE